MVNNNRKFVSKVDEKLKAAEARRAELERAKNEELQKKLAARRDRMKKSASIDENLNNSNNQNVSMSRVPMKNDIKEYTHMKCSKTGRLIEINWTAKRKSKKLKYQKLFSIAAVENLIQNGSFDLAEVILGILRRSIESRHVIQNKFAHLHGRIIEIKERNKRAFTHESALNFTGSISPVRVPDFEVDLNQLSKISSPIGMEELSGKYDGSGGDSFVVVGRPVFASNLANHEFNPFDNDDILDHLDSSDLNTNSNTGNNANTNTGNPYLNHNLSPSKSPKKQSNSNFGTEENNFPTVISPLKRPRKEIEADTVYTPQRKSARRVDSQELIYDQENVSQILINDPNAAFISNPYITMPKKNKRDEQEKEEEEE